MNRIRDVASRLLLLLSLVLVLGNTPTVSVAQEKADTPAAAPAPAPAAAPDPTLSPTESDSTGGKYTGANSTSALTGDKDAKTRRITVTPLMSADIRQLKLAVNIFWTLSPASS